MLKWVMGHLVLFNSDIRVVVIHPQEMPKSLFWLTSSFAHWSEIIYLRRGPWTPQEWWVDTAVQNGTVSVEVKNLEWKLLNYCVNEKLVSDQKLTKVKSQAAGFKWVQEFPRCWEGKTEPTCLRVNGFLLLTELSAFRNTIKKDFVTTCQVVLIHGHCGKAFLQRYTSN